MKSVLFLLLFAFLLVAMPAVATDLVSVDAWLIPGVIETESVIKEEVTVTSGSEILADILVSPYQQTEAFTHDVVAINKPDALYDGTAARNGNNINEGLLAGVLFNTALG